MYWKEEDVFNIIFHTTTPPAFTVDSAYLRRWGVSTGLGWTWNQRDHIGSYPKLAGYVLVFPPFMFSPKPVSKLVNPVPVLELIPNLLYIHSFKREKCKVCWHLTVMLMRTSLSRSPIESPIRKLEKCIKGGLIIPWQFGSRSCKIRVIIGF